MSKFFILKHSLIFASRFATANLVQNVFQHLDLTFKRYLFFI
jgi:hypothetical protein